ncbi:Protein MOR1 [Zea mays]|uniref:Protein MOR1 n=1 Tax=Zea mays TaxID=4577 RepID=A0A1D6GGM5_MAIZE|nr:Protein MOR1 [Zea mays]
MASFAVSGARLGVVRPGGSARSGGERRSAVDLPSLLFRRKDAFSPCKLVVSWILSVELALEFAGTVLSCAGAPGKAFQRLGRVWRRSYLLYGPLGTGKSTFAAATARFLGYDVDLSHADAAGDDLCALLLHTTSRSLVLVEDLDRYLQGGGGDTEARVARVLSFMDGVASCCSEERVMVFTMRGGKDAVDAVVVRPGRLDVHIQFTLCDFEAFKALFSNYLGLKDHKLYPQWRSGSTVGVMKEMVNAAVDSDIQLWTLRTWRKNYFIFSDRYRGMGMDIDDMSYNFCLSCYVSPISYMICDTGLKELLSLGERIAELFSALRGRLYDNNKNLVMAILSTIGGLASAMGPSVEKSSKGILADVLKCLGDNKKHMRECTLTVIDSWVAAAQLEKMVPYIIVSLGDQKTGSEGRKDLFDWLSRHVSKMGDSSEALPLFKPSASSLMVKSSEVRKAAEYFMNEILRSCGQEVVGRNLKDLPSPTLAIVSERLKLSTVHEAFAMHVDIHDV